MLLCWLNLLSICLNPDFSTGYAGSISFWKYILYQKVSDALRYFLCSHKLLLSFVDTWNKSLTVLPEALLVNGLHSLVFISSVNYCGCLCRRWKCNFIALLVFAETVVRHILHLGLSDSVFIGFPLLSGTNPKYLQMVDLVFGLSVSETSDNSKGTIAILLFGN